MHLRFGSVPALGFLRAVFWVVTRTIALVGGAGTIAATIRGLPNGDGDQYVWILRWCDAVVAISLIILRNNPLDLLVSIVIVACVRFMWAEPTIAARKKEFDERRQNAYNASGNRKLRTRRKGGGK